MFTSIKDFIKAKKAENNTKIAATNENAIINNTTTKIAKVDNSTALLESVIKNLSVCHFIMTNGLINESASLTSINEAIDTKFGTKNFFKTENDFNYFYVNSLNEMQEYLIAEGALDKISSFFNKATNKTYILDDKLVASDKAKEFLNDVKYAKIVKMAKETLAKKGIPEDKVELALTALLNWTNGETPNFSNTNINYDSAKNELTIGSSAKGAGAKVF